MGKRFFLINCFIMIYIISLAATVQASWLAPEPTIRSFYINLLGRNPSKAEVQKKADLVRYRKQNMLQILDGFFDSKEYKNHVKDFSELEMAYLTILNRPIDPEGRENYLDKMSGKKGKKWTIKQVENDIAHSQEARETAVRQLYMQYLYRDADAPGLADKVGKMRGRMSISYRGIKRVRFGGSALSSIKNEIVKSYEHRHFTGGGYLAVVSTIRGFYKNILGRNADAGGLRYWLQKWATGTTLLQIRDSLMNGDEFKKRHLSKGKEAYLRFLLRPGDSGGLHTYSDEYRRDGEDAANTMLKRSEEGQKAAMRMLYWQILNRDADKGGLKAQLEYYKTRYERNKHSQFQQRGGGNAYAWAYQDVAYRMLGSDEAKNYRKNAAVWASLSKDMESLWTEDMDTMVTNVTELAKKYKDETDNAKKKYADLIKTAPKEFSDLQYLLDDPLKGKNLAEMKTWIKNLKDFVKSLGVLKTADIQKIFVETLGRPAPDFYALLNNSTSWEGAPDQLGMNKNNFSGGRPGKGGLPKVGPSATPAIPGMEARPGDNQLLPLIQRALVDASDAKDFKNRLLAIIVSSQQFKDRLPIRERAIRSLYMNILQREPDSGGFKFYLDQLNSGKIYPDDIARQLKGSPEYKDLQKLMAGKIRAFLPVEKRKVENDDKADDDKIKNNELKLSDLHGFDQFAFAKDVIIKDPQKVENENGVCYTGTADIFGLRNVKVFAKKHPSAKGYPVYVVGAFFNGTYKVKDAYRNIDSSLRTFMDMLQFSDGALIHSSGNVVLQLASLPANVKHEFSDILKESGHKSLALKEGRNIVGNMGISTAGAGKHLQKLLPSSTKSLLLQGLITKDPKKIIITGNIPAFRPKFFPKECDQIEPKIEFTGVPEVAIKMKMAVTLPEKQPMTAVIGFQIPLEATGKMQIMAALKGMWKNPMKIKGLTVGNLILSGTIDVEKMAPSFGLAGDFRIAQKIVRIAANIPLTQNISTLSLLGSLNALSTRDLLALYKEMGGKIFTVPFPADAVGVKDVSLSISEKGDNTLKIPEGVNAKGELYIRSGRVAHIDAVVSKVRGIYITGEANRLELGPLELTGTKRGTGATVNIQFPLRGCKARIDGQASLFGVGDELSMILDRRGMGFSYQKSMTRFWQVKVESMGNFDAAHPDFKVKYEVSSDLSGALQDAVKDIGHIPGFVLRIFKHFIVVRKAGFDGSLASTIHGDIPDFYINVGVMGKDYTERSHIQIPQPPDAVNSLAHTVYNTAKSRIEDFVRKFLDALKGAWTKKGRAKLRNLINEYQNKSYSGLSRNELYGKATVIGRYYN